MQRGDMDALRHWLSNWNCHQKHLGVLWNHIAGPYPQNFWSSGCGVGPENSYFYQVPRWCSKGPDSENHCSVNYTARQRLRVFWVYLTTVRCIGRNDTCSFQRSDKWPNNPKSPHHFIIWENFLWLFVSYWHQVLLGSTLPSVPPSNLCPTLTKNNFSAYKHTQSLLPLKDLPRTQIHFQMAVTSLLFTIKHVKKEKKVLYIQRQYFIGYILNP